MRTEVLAFVWMLLLRLGGELVRKSATDECKRDGGRRCGGGGHGEKLSDLIERSSSSVVCRSLQDCYGELILHGMRPLPPCLRIRGAGKRAGKKEQEDIRSMYEEAGGHHKVEGGDDMISQLLSSLHAEERSSPDLLAEALTRRFVLGLNETAEPLNRSGGSMAFTLVNEMPSAYRECFCCRSKEVTYGLAEDRWKAGWGVVFCLNVTILWTVVTHFGCCSCVRIADLRYCSSKIIFLLMLVPQLHKRKKIARQQERLLELLSCLRKSA
eukprot:766512-Hanusia_phi.AAC.3